MGSASLSNEPGYNKSGEYGIRIENFQRRVISLEYCQIYGHASTSLKLGAQMIEFRHAPIWQLIFPGRTAGEVVRALAWLGPEKAGEAIQKLRAKLPASELKEVASARSRLPTWMAQEVSALVTHG